MTRKQGIFISLILGILIAVPICYYLVGIVAFKGDFDTNYTRDELTKNFNNHEKNFEDLVIYFRSNTKSLKCYSIRFKLEKSDKISLYLLPEVTDPKNKAIGGKNMSSDSPQLDSALRVLHWNKNIAYSINDKLSKIGYDHVSISVAEIDGRISIYPEQSGWGSFEYLVDEEPFADTIAISHSKFGRHVKLYYSSAL